jgi:hypothetical protein
VGHRIFVDRKKLTIRDAVLTIVILILSSARAFAVNERRVVFEIFIPAIVYVLFARREWGVRAKFLLAWGPLLGSVSLIVIFLSTEYFRTWVNFYSNGRSADSYLSWALTRLAGYYATAMNNGATLWADGVNTGGTITFAGFLKLPFFSEMLGLNEYRVQKLSAYKFALKRLTNPELNNPGGSIVPLMEFGLIWGGAIIASFGAACGYYYKRAQYGSVFAVLLYTMFFMSILELTRVWFISGPIALINLVYIFVFFALRQRGNAARVPSSMQRGRA